MGEEQLEEFKKQLYGMEQYRTCQQQIRQLENRLWEGEDDLEKARMASRKEEQDVEELEQNGLHKISLKITGKYSAAKEKEVQEAKEAQIAFGQKVIAVEEVEQQIEEWKQKQIPYIECEKSVKDLYEDLRKTNALTKEMKESLAFEYEQKVKELTEDMSEVRKIINLGYGVSDELKKIEQGLETAFVMGQVDIYSSSQRANVSKPLTIMDAESRWERLQSLLKKLERESQKVNRTIQVSGEMKFEGGAMFADLFVDTMFTDRNMQVKIDTSKENISKRKQKIDSMIKQLIHYTDWEKLRIREYEKQIDELKKTLES